jgi:hypothetical protein
VCEEPVPKSSGVGLRDLEGLEPDSPAAARGRFQPGRDLTLSSVKGYESGVLKSKHCGLESESRNGHEDGLR